MSSALFDDKAVEDNEDSPQEGSKRSKRSVAAESDDGDDDEGDRDEGDSTAGGHDDGDGRDSDSSEEEDDDDDEEAARAVREGFIVDSDQDEEDNESGGDQGGGGAVERRRRRKKKRHVEEDEDLDEDDLDLVLENRGRSGGRLKRRRQDGLQELFSDDEEQDEEDEDDDAVDATHRGGARARMANRNIHDEFADFIEDDEFPEGDEQGDEEDDERVTSRRTGAGAGSSGSGFRPEQLGISEDDAAQVYEIFGDGDEYAYALEGEDEEEEGLDQRTEALDLKDVFEPSELAAKMLTDQDEIIRVTDRPERFQLDRPSIQVNIEKETEWIARNMKMNVNLPQRFAPYFKTAISHVLNFMERDLVEVPFIWKHRRDYLDHIERSDNPEEPSRVYAMLELDDIWTVYDLDRAYRSLEEKRESLRKFFESLNFEDAFVKDAIEGATTQDELTDIHDYLNFAFPDIIRDNRVASSKRPPRRSLFSQYRNSSLYGLVKAYGITAANFGQNWVNHHKTYYADDESLPPLDFAKAFVEPPVIKSAEDALHMARQVLADEISHDLNVRKAIRAAFFKYAVVSTKPTALGVTKIDIDHPCYCVKYLRDRPISTFIPEPEKFMLVLKAEGDALLSVSITMDDEQALYREVIDYLQSDNMSEAAIAWNDERRRLLDLAMKDLKEQTVRSLKSQFVAECESNLKAEVRSAALAKFNQAPYQPVHAKLSPGDIPTVVALSNGRGIHAKDAIICVYTDEDGKVKDTIKINTLDTGRAEFSEFLDRNRPDAIGVSGYHVSAMRLREDLDKFFAEEPEDRKIDVTWVPDDTARFYQNSKEAETEYPNLPPLGRYCVSICRYLQNPVLEYISMGPEISSVIYTQTQSLLPQETLLAAIDSALIDTVAIIGVDINEAVRNERTARLLPYISGLGPRKASAIVKRIQAVGGSLVNRTELITKSILTRNIFMNSASFMYINSEETANTDILDTTRIHNEDYELAKKMASDALDLDEEDLVDFEEPSGVVAQLINDNEEDKLDDLVLEEYADQLEKAFHSLKRRTLEQIRQELKSPYGELRKPFHQLSTNEIFFMLTGENDTSLNAGMVVSVVVRRISHSFATGRLESDIHARAGSSDISDEYPPQIEQGQTLQGVILTIYKDQLSVDVDLKASSVKQALEHRRLRFSNEPFWDVVQERETEQKFASAKVKATRATRVIKHPLFRNFSAREAENYLSTMQRGDLVIRPSNRGPDHIAVTWKVSDGLYQHLDVQELDKPNEFSLGRVLRIGQNYSYSDLDELIVMHVKATARKVEEMVHHEKFQKGTRDDTNQWLMRYSEANPRRSAYAFCFDRSHPGYFDLCFKANLKSEIHSWHVKAIPNAFQLRGNVYGDMNTLCNGFKILFGNAQREQQLLQQQQQQYRGTGPPSYAAVR